MRRDQEGQKHASYCCLHREDEDGCGVIHVGLPGVAI